MILHDKTKNKIESFLEIAISFIEKYDTKNSPDISFIISAFASKFKTIKLTISTNNLKSNDYHNDIYEFDNIISSWLSNLPHVLSNTEKTQNNIYDVLFSILQAIDNIIEQDHFYWSEESNTLTEIDNT